AVVVVGSPASANTSRLKSVAAASRPTFAAESAADVDPASLARFRKVGIAAGASTPDSAIAEVRDAVARIAPAR
ncbi:MAG: 4-hydroxy-3-methylbut-2-enyl diphosphate reductase, partial [Kiritimatiellae bacterium]|nr:4-hydroxy-3-methylbut-2-enyl diphosphate reductase [Kiritimatiellia bacterium]